VSRVLAVLALAVLAAPALAGCVAPDPGPVGGLDPTGLPANEALPYLDIAEGHDHADLASHDAGWNLDVVAWSLYGHDPQAPGRYNQVHLAGDLALVSAYAIPPSNKPGLIVVNLSDPLAPLVVGTWVSEFTTTIDVHATKDGRYVALAGHRHATVNPPPGVAPGCTSVPLPGRAPVLCPPFVPAGVTLLDLAEPAKPKKVAEWVSAPSGAHTVKLHEIGNKVYAFIASYGLSYVDRMASAVEIVQFDSGFPGGFRPVTRLFPSESSGGRVFVHDIFVQRHPATDQTILYVAYWDGGVLVADVSDPSKPRELAAWKDFDVAEYGNIHFVQPMPGLVDGRHYTVAAPEYASAQHAGESYVLDTTDPAKPKLLAKWHLPGNPLNPEGYLHSPHNFDLTADGKLVMGHYHAGVWVLDLNPVFRAAGGNATAEAEGANATAEPRVLAYRFPVPPNGTNVTVSDYAPHVWNAQWRHDGLVVASDVITGLYVMRLADVADDAVAPYAAHV